MLVIHNNVLFVVLLIKFGGLSYGGPYDCFVANLILVCHEKDFGNGQYWWKILAGIWYLDIFDQQCKCKFVLFVVVLYNLQVRFCERNYIYTYCGLLCVYMYIYILIYQLPG